MPKIAITTTSFGKHDDSPLKLCKEKGYEIILNPYGRKITSDEFGELAKDAIGVIAGTESINEAVASKLSSLKVISRCGAGIDNIEMPAMKKLRIKVFNTPDAPTLAVAELTVGLILGLLRKVVLMDSALRKGRWNKLMGNLLYGKRVGIVGFGRIGQKVAELLKGFGCKIAYSDPDVEGCISGADKLPFEELLAWADVISLHTGGKDNLLGEKEFKLLKKEAYVVNTSRGTAIDEEIAYEYLKERKIAGMALDVFSQEPYAGPLKGLDNVILTPHIGSYAKEARVNMEMQAVENLLKGLSE